MMSSCFSSCSKVEAKDVLAVVDHGGVRRERVEEGALGLAGHMRLEHVGYMPVKECKDEACVGRVLNKALRVLRVSV